VARLIKPFRLRELEAAIVSALARTDFVALSR
jgi:hypothetical protein